MTKYEEELKRKKREKSYSARLERFGEAAEEFDEVHAWYVAFRAKHPKKENGTDGK